MARTFSRRRKRVPKLWIGFPRESKKATAFQFPLTEIHRSCTNFEEAPNWWSMDAARNRRNFRVEENSQAKQSIPAKCRQIFTLVCTISVLTTSNTGAEDALAQRLDRLHLFSTTGTVRIQGSNGRERTVTILKDNPDPFTSATESRRLMIRPGETLITEEGATAQVFMPAGAMQLNANTTVKVPESPKRKDEEIPHSLQLLKGELFLEITPNPTAKTGNPKRDFRLKTPALVLAVKGTQLFANVSNQAEMVGVHEGRILVEKEVNGRVAAVPLTTNRVIALQDDGKAQVRPMSNKEAELSSFYGKFAIKPVAPETTPDHTEFWKCDLTGTPYTDALGKPYGITFETTANPFGQGRLAKLEFPRSMLPTVDLSNNSSPTIQTELQLSKDHGIPRGMEFFVRGTGFVSLTVVTTIEDTLPSPHETMKMETETLDLSNGEWNRFVFPVLGWHQDRINPHAIVRFNTVHYLNKGDNLDGNSDDFGLEIAPGSVLYTD